MAMTGIPLSAITAIYYVYPALNILYFLLASLMSTCALPTLPSEVKNQHPRQQVILMFMLGVPCEYIIQALLLSVNSFIPTTLVVHHDETVYLLFSALVWAIQYIVLAESKFPVWYSYYVNWASAILVEITLVIPSVIHKPTGASDFASISLQFLRISNLIALLCLYSLLCNSRDKRDDDIERQSLLANQGTTNYGVTATVHNAAIERDDEEEELSNKTSARLANARSWWDYVNEFKIFLPYLWPDENLLQFYAVLLGIYPFASNALDLLVLRQLGIFFDSFKSGNEIRLYSESMILGVLWLLSSDAGIKWLQSYLWKPLQLHGYKAINTAAHSHVMNLSLDFHEGKSPQAIHHDMYQGQSITNLVDRVCFKLIPMLLGISITCGYLCQRFGAYMALNVAFTTLLYLYVTAKLVRRTTPPRRDYTRYYRKAWKSGHSTIDCWQLASYHDNLTFEHGRYVSNVKMQLKYRRKYSLAMSLVSASQSVIINLGQIAACSLAIYQSTHEISSLGDVVVLLSYWGQLHSQLSFFSNAYTSIFEDMMDAERLLGILKTKASIVDKDDAESLHLQTGEVKFTDVEFDYGQKAALKGVTIIVPGGKTVGIVGSSGAGKSTTIKLLARFYDPKKGSIQIDGQEIRDVTLKSLRKHIGVVSQDPTLIDASIMDNIRYARMDASDEEVYDACKLAAIHDRIISFPNGYDTRVGSRGEKLSGGEKQRVSIARVILKAPKIIVLDEATSAVDTITEQSIQVGLDAISTGCTVLVIAHRLSTISDADLIVVMDDGAVVEQGTHDYLLSIKGKYCELWDAQTRKKSPQQCVKMAMERLDGLA